MMTVGPLSSLGDEDSKTTNSNHVYSLTPSRLTERDILSVLANPKILAIHFQPIVDLQRGTVVGYEALSRFTVKPHLGPEVWFTTAEKLGLAAELESLAIKEARRRYESFPPNQLLSVNVSPQLINSPEIDEALSGRLDGVIVELTEHVEFNDIAELKLGLTTLRRRGAMIAIDDAGAGYSGLKLLTTVRPELVKIDRELIVGIDTDEVKATLAQMLGDFVGKLNSWILAEGIETQPELDRVASLGIPLGQGWALAKSDPLPKDLESGLSFRLASKTSTPKGDEVAIESLCDPVPVIEETETPQPHTQSLVVIGVDSEHHPSILWLRTSTTTSSWVGKSNILCAKPGDSVKVISQRALLRVSDSRFDPVVLTSPTGRVVGIVRMESILRSLATTP